MDETREKRHIHQGTTIGSSMPVAENNEGHFPQATTLTTIAGEPIPALAREFGTPVYVYDAAPIARRIAQLKQFDAIRYAQKACSNLAILDLVRRHGVVRRLP